MKRLLFCLFIWVAMCALLCGCQTRETADTTPPRLIAHGGGAIYGYRLTNSKEAIDHAYGNGFRYIELDFECTSDGVYVLLHDWESMAGRLLLSAGIRTHGEFLSSETFGNLTLLDLDGLLSWLDRHPDCRIVTDAKCENLPFLTQLSTLPEAKKAQFIPQVYSYEEYGAAKALGFADIILTLYAMDCDESTLLAFAETEHPWAITIPETYLSDTLLQSLATRGVITYTHTVNDLYYYETWQAKGLYGIYTDYFEPKHWVN